ncbi:substrate-binding domain-containing protein [Streptomyces hokutonensis]|uniref:substrate-binding domain-containing protein n=1 Tax=Streptomyces hokutonensis TaxID=1306990 RepID=UPI00037321BB|nr:substrate-binding domain-containing protein [Streptomyces hokutonensis]
MPAVALGVTAHGSTPRFPYWHPPITVVDNGARDLGELAAEQLLRRIDNRPDNGDTGEEGVGRLIRVGSRLVVRDSTTVTRRSG